jgi:hypothetical protein
MEVIQPPHIARLGAKRLDACRAALGAAFLELADRAVAAGWNETEIALALADISEAHVESVAKMLDMRVASPAGAATAGKGHQAHKASMS